MVADESRQSEFILVLQKCTIFLRLKYKTFNFNKLFI